VGADVNWRWNGFREIERDALADGVNSQAARIVLWLPLVGAVLVAATALSRPLFLALVREDGPIEWLQFMAFFAAATLLALAGTRLARRGDIAGAVLISVGALGIVGIAGEEISWGQRLLDLETPESLGEVNHQNEINLHNITAFPVQRIGNYLQFLLGGAGLVLPWLTRTRRPVVTHRLLRLLSPPLFVTTGFGLLFAYRAVRFAWDSEAMTVVKYGEWPELAFALGLAVYGFLLARGLRGADPDQLPEHSPRAGWVGTLLRSWGSAGRPPAA
jgi:hypothetical protein